MIDEIPIELLIENRYHSAVCMECVSVVVHYIQMFFFTKRMAGNLCFVMNCVFNLYKSMRKKNKYIRAQDYL